MSQQSLILQLTDRANTFTFSKETGYRKYSINYINFEFSYLKTSINFSEMINIKNLFNSHNKDTKIKRVVYLKDNLICDNKYLLDKYNIRNRKSNKYRFEVNYIFAIPTIIYTEMNEIYNYDDFLTSYTLNEYFIMINLLTGLINNCILDYEYKLLIKLMSKDAVLKLFINENELQDNPLVMREMIIDFLLPLYNFIDNFSEKHNTVLKSASDFRFIFYLQNTNLLGTVVDKFNVTYSKNQTYNILQPKIFTDTSLITDFYEQIFDKVNTNKKKFPVYSFTKGGYVI